MSSGKDVLHLLHINYYLTLTYCQSEKFYFSVSFLRMINSGQYKFLCFFMLMTFLSEWLRAISVVRNAFFKPMFFVFWQNKQNAFLRKEYCLEEFASHHGSGYSGWKLSFAEDAITLKRI